MVEQLPWSRLGRQENASVLLADSVIKAGGLDPGVAASCPLEMVRSAHPTGPTKDWAPNLSLSLHEGGLWVATDGGLSRLKDGHRFDKQQRIAL